MLVYVPQKRSTAAARTWLLLIFLLPWPGLLLYVLFGRIRVPRRSELKRQERASRRIREVQAQMGRRLEAMPGTGSKPRRRRPPLRNALAISEIFAGNSIELAAGLRRLHRTAPRGH